MWFLFLQTQSRINFEDKDRKSSMQILWSAAKFDFTKKVLYVLFYRSLVYISIGIVLSAGAVTTLI